MASSENEIHERLRKLSEHLKGLTDREFEMQRVFHSCGSPACIAGHLLYLNGVSTEKNTYDDLRTAGELLGMGYSKARSLFVPWDTSGLDFSYSADITPQKAAEVIDHLLATGEVDWLVAFPEERERIRAEREEAQARLARKFS